MKNSLFVMIGTFLFTLSGVALSSALQSEEDLLDSIFEEAGIERFETNIRELQALAEEDEETLKNLYLFMYQNVKLGAQDAALVELSDRTDYSVSELKAIVVDGNTEPIELPDYATQDDLLNAYSNLRELYEFELEFQRDSQRLSYQTLATELFMNGDLNDSAGIDLLYQLDLIHYLLFGETIEFPDRSGSDVFAYDLPSAPEESTDETAALLEQVSLAEELDSTDPYACFDDALLREAIEEFESSTASSGGGSSSSGSSSSGGTSGASSEEGENISTVEELNDFVSSLEGVAGDWTRSLPCNEIFCITIELVTERIGLNSSYGGAGDYQENANCIACHIAYIQTRMEETLAKPLVPSKVSTNWFEDATCKSAGYGVNLDLNVYTIPRPIALDAGADIDDIADENIEDLQNTLISIGSFPLPGGSRTVSNRVEDNLADRALEEADEILDGETRSDASCQALINLYEIGDVDGQIEKAILRCAEAQELLLEESQEAFDAFVFNAEAQNSNVLYEQLLGEFYTMTLTFAAFQEALQDTYLSDDAPLPSLISKDYCS